VATIATIATDQKIGSVNAKSNANTYQQTGGNKISRNNLYKFCKFFVRHQHEKKILLKT
jgi:hypothetical protein